MDKNDSPVRSFTIKDAISGALDGERIAVLGYGHLGRPFAMNLRDSGIAPVLVGNIADEYASQARLDGFDVLSLAQAAVGADIAIVLLPDEVIPEVFAAEIEPNLSPGSALVFASGYTLAYGLVKPLSGIDTLLLAPRMGGEQARQRYLRQQGFFAYISVEQDASGNAWRRLLGLAHSVGVLQAGALELNARQEADLDLFIEQSLGAVLGTAILSAFAIGVEAGIPPEAMVVEMYQSGEMESVWRAFREQGLFHSSDAHGPTALYGGFIRTMQWMNSDLGDRFRQTLAEIQNGDFARQFQDERQAGYPMLTMAMKMKNENPLAEAERRTRLLFPGA